MPVPVEPMKAIGAIVIVEGFTAQEIAASGIVLGVLFVVLGFFKGMNILQDKIPKSVIRGIQLSLALLLLNTSLKFVIEDYMIAFICIFIAILFLIAGKLGKIPDISSLLILLIGIAVGISRFGIPQINMISLPAIIIPTVQDFLTGIWMLAIPQAPLTITNAILATVLLMQDLVHRKVEPDKLSISIGFMNLFSVPFGGFPMCHGAGGLAAQYRFGARTGGSNIISGLILLPIALYFASPEFVTMIPVGVFGALLFLVAIELGKYSLKTDSYTVTVGMAMVSFFTNMTFGFIVGIMLVYLSKLFKK